MRRPRQISGSIAMNVFARKRIFARESALAKSASLALLALLGADLAAGPALAKQRAHRCVCPERTAEYREPCESRTTYVRRVVERRTVFIEPAAVVAAPAPVYVAYPAFGYGDAPSGYGGYYAYGYPYAPAGIINAGFGAYGIGWGGWGW
jgi:hypothetical protein